MKFGQALQALAQPAFFGCIAESNAVLAARAERFAAG